MLENKLLKEEKYKRKKENKVDQLQTKAMVTIPYIRGFSEALQKTFRINGVETAMKPQKDLEAALGAPQGQAANPGLSRSSILHPLQRLPYGIYRLRQAEGMV